MRTFRAGDADHAAFGLQDEVQRGALQVRPVLAVARDRAVDDAGIALAPGLVVEAQALQRPGPVVFQHDVGTLDHAQEQFLAFLVLQVEHHALLVAVQAHEIRRLAARQRRAPGARDVALHRAVRS